MHTSCMFKYISQQPCVNLSHGFLTALANIPDSSLFFLRSDLTMTAHEHGIYSTKFARLFCRKNTSVTMLVTLSWPYTLLIHPSPRFQASCPQKITSESISGKSLGPNPVRTQPVCGRTVPSQCVRYVKVFTGLKCASSSLSSMSEVRSFPCLSLGWSISLLEKCLHK